MDTPNRLQAREGADSMTHDSTPHASVSGAANQAGSFHIYQKPPIYPKPPKTFIEQAGIMASSPDLRERPLCASQARV
jgi:hypothetical protein